MSLDRRAAVHPGQTNEPGQAPEPYPEDEDFAPNPSRITQPTWEEGLGIAPGILTRWQGTSTTQEERAPALFEGRELRPPVAVPSGADVEPGQGFVVHHEHHHFVETVEGGQYAHTALTVALDNTQPFRILAHDSGRTRATVVNQSGSTSTVVIGFRPDIPTVANSGTAVFPLAPGASLDIRSTDEVWAAIPAGGAATVSMWITRNLPRHGDNQS